MTEIAGLKDTIRVCMFDQYGTVVDMQGGLTKVAAPYLESKGWKGKPDSFVTWWRRTHFENSMIDALLHKAHTPYREIGFRAVDHVLNRCGIAHTDDEVRALVAEIEKLECFPEVPAALAKLQRRYKLVVLSNGDPDMLEAAKSYHKVPFDRVISVAEANAFKPHVATYTRAEEIIGVPMEQVLFVANHAFDVIGAKAAGVASIHYKDESRRFGEGLASFKALGAPYAVIQLLADLVERETGHRPTSSELRSGKHKQLTESVTVSVATDGNQGRGLAWAAQQYGCKCAIFIHSHVSKGRKAAMKSFGAKVVRVNGEYLDLIRCIDAAVGINC